MWVLQGEPMNGIARKLSPATLILVLICFFLPFVTFSCQGQRIASLSGMQLATGTTVQQPQMFGPPKTQKIDAEPLASLALLCVLVGLGLSFLKGKKGAVGSAALACLAVFLLVGLKSQLESDALQQAGGVAQLSFDAGYYFSLVLLIAATGLGVYGLLVGSGVRVPSLDAGGENRFCGQCGARNAGGDSFCRECGAKFP